MTPPLVEALDSAAEARWQAWQARGVASDSRYGRIMGWLFAVAMTLLVGRFLYELL